MNRIISPRTVLLSLLMATFVFSISSCKKYEQGPIISLRTKTKRLTGEWKVMDNFDDYLNVNYTLTYEFEMDGDFKETITQTNNGTYEVHTQEGKWKWEPGKESIQIEYDAVDWYEGLNVVEDFEVTRLTNDEFWFKRDNGEHVECKKE
ncbi:MAG: hypothetical protein KDC12_15145 [Flavobacteriales bacterium]|nr:hypothetical protein [Flavobacteriales bacterium]